MAAKKLPTDPPAQLPAVQEIIVPGVLPGNVGKPPHEPTEKDRMLVRLGSATGMPQEDIAKVIGITAKTLREHYRDELDTGKAKANMMVAGELYKLCAAGNVAAILFWCKHQMNFVEDPERAPSELIDVTPASQLVINAALESLKDEF